jgi:hypothetical protein
MTSSNTKTDEALNKSSANADAAKTTVAVKTAKKDDTRNTPKMVGTDHCRIERLKLSFLKVFFLHIFNRALYSKY